MMEAREGAVFLSSLPSRSSGPAVQGEYTLSGGQVPEHGTQPQGLGQCQALYLTFPFTDKRMLSLSQLLSQPL